MNALLKIRAKGFSICEDDGKLFVSPASDLDTQQLEYIKANKPAILQQLRIEKAYQWLAGIGEDDPLTISEFINDPEKLTGLLAGSLHFPVNSLTNISQVL
jgi:hypothetical protein